MKFFSYLAVILLVVSGNKFEFSKDYVALHDVPAIDLDYCDNVIVENNSCQGFKLPLKVRASKDTESVKLAPEQGLALERQ